MQLGQFINNFGLDQRGIHIEDEEAAVAPVDTLALKRNINLKLMRQIHQFGPQFG